MVLIYFACNFFLISFALHCNFAYECHACVCMPIERTAQSINAERKKPEPISEDIHRQYVQQLQDTLLTDIQKNLEDFRWHALI